MVPRPFHLLLECVVCIFSSYHSNENVHYMGISSNAVVGVTYLTKSSATFIDLASPTLCVKETF
jgi:hypothetical protein